MARGGGTDVLIVEEDVALGRELHAFLASEAYDPEWVRHADEAFNRLDLRPFDVLVSEMRIGLVDGHRILTVAKERNPNVCAIMLAEHGEVERATAAVQRGAYDYQLKPVNFLKLRAVIERGRAFQELALEQVALKRRLDARYGLASLIGNSRQMAQVYAAVRQTGPTEQPVLILGEEGVGKQRVAQALHHNSPRREEIFLHFDCASGDSQTLDRQLFGYGGEGQAEQGAFEVADRGTLYLANMHALSTPLQERVEEYLRRRVIRRAGDRKPLAPDVRVIAAGQKRIEAEGRGLFSEEPLKRLGVVVIEVAPLRERPEDIAPLAEQLLEELAQERGEPGARLDPQTLHLLTRHDWPQNASELRNVLNEMLMGTGEDETLQPQRLPPYLQHLLKRQELLISAPVGATLAQLERQAIEVTLAACAGNKEECAKMLGISLRTLYRKLKQYEEDQV